MKCPRLSRATSPSSRRRRSPNLNDLVAMKDCIFRMLNGDLYRHDTIRRILDSAGLITRRIERMEGHPVWLLGLTRTTFDLDTDTTPKSAHQGRHQDRAQRVPHHRPSGR